MARERAEGSVELKRTPILFEGPLLVEADGYLFDPVRNKLSYGARSKLMNTLLREWVNKERKRRRKLIKQKQQEMKESEEHV